MTKVLISYSLEVRRHISRINDNAINKTGRKVSTIGLNLFDYEAMWAVVGFIVKYALIVFLWMGNI